MKSQKKSAQSDKRCKSTKNSQKKVVLSAPNSMANFAVAGVFTYACTVFTKVVYNYHISFQRNLIHIDVE